MIATKNISRPNRHLPRNIFVRIIYRPQQITPPPKLNDGRFVAKLKRANLHTCQAA
jgi:hypothetical protein